MLHLIKVMKKIVLSFFAVVGAAAFAAPAFAWTNPAANPATGGGAVTAEQNAPANSIRIKANGSIGINSANPETGRKLEVIGGTTNVHTASFIGASGVGVAIGYDGHETYASIQAFNKSVELVPDRYLPLLLNAGGGNVGVGLTDPEQKFSVAGIIRSTSGGIMFPDGTTQTTAFSGGSQTISAANISAGQFGANTGGGNYSFPLASQVGFGNFTIRRISTTSIGFYDSTGALAVEFDEGT